MPGTVKTKSEIEQLIVSFIVNDLQAATAQDLDPEANLFAGGYLDSISIMRLIAHVESSLALKIPPRDLVPRHFMTIKAMVEYLHPASQPAR
jgi:acyl carrier protein